MLSQSQFIARRIRLVSSVSSASSVSTAPLTSLTSSRHLSTNQPQQQRKEITKEVQREEARKYNNRRAAYKRAVSALRIKYASEVSQQRATDQKQQAALKASQTRARLERQRLKNLASVKNALKQEKHRLKASQSFQAHLQAEQIKREAKAQRFTDARRIVLEELNQESTQWLTSKQEIDNAFDGTPNEQKLWTRPGGFIGAPIPSEDAQFWRYESHTWDMVRTYPTPRELLLNDLQELAYLETNIDENYWTKERLLAQNELEQKAKLRAIVREEGRRALLVKQRQLMQDQHALDNSNDNYNANAIPNLPKPMPAPSLSILKNYDAMEKEGFALLEQDPTKFFVFDATDGATTDVSDDDSTSNNDDKDSSSSSSVAALGKPIRLIDPIRDTSPTQTPFPQIIGRLPKPDTRTEREKKREEREERMLAAAQAAEKMDKDADGSGSSTDGGVEYEPEDELPSTGGEPVDYDAMYNKGSADDIAWEEMVDPQRKDAHNVSNTASMHRFSENDVDWVIQELEKKVNSLKEIVRLEQESDRQKSITTSENESAGEDGNDGDNIQDALGVETVKSKRIDEKGREYTSYDVIDGNEDGNGKNNNEEFDLKDLDLGLDLENTDMDKDIDSLELDDLINMQDTENVLGTLTEEQISALQNLDQDDSISSNAEEIKATLSKVPGLSEEQIESLVALELALSQNDDVRKTLERGGKEGSNPKR